MGNVGFRVTFWFGQPSPLLLVFQTLPPDFDCDLAAPCTFEELGSEALRKSCKPHRTLALELHAGVGHTGLAWLLQTLATYGLRLAIKVWTGGSFG